MKKKLDIQGLIKAAKEFCKEESGVFQKELYAVTDGKAVGTFIEHKFQQYLSDRYSMEIGSSANGLDLPSINTDIKTTSIHQPQSSCPFNNSTQKIYGLGYNLIIFVYQKEDDNKSKQSKLDFLFCFFVEASRTADYQTTIGLNDIINRNGNVEDICAFLSDRNLPVDEVTLLHMSENILKNPPEIGYLTISNALQWRLQYSRLLKMTEPVLGITHILRCNDK